MLRSMDISMELLFKENVSDEIVFSVDFTYKSGSPPHMGSLTYPGDPGDPAEIEIDSIWWVYKKKVDDREVEDHHPLPLILFTDKIYDAIEEHILENYKPEYEEDI